MKSLNKSFVDNYDPINLTEALTITNGGSFTGFRKDCFEKDINDIIAKRFPTANVNSIYLPHELFNKRVMTLGGDLQSTAQSGFRFIPQLTEVKYAEPLYKKIGVEEVDIDKGRLAVPISPTAPEAEWLDETFGPETIDDISLADFQTIIPLRVQVGIEFTKIADILLQPAGINMLVMILRSAIDKKLDTTFFYGDSNNMEPDGIINNSDVQQISAATFNLAQAVNFIKEVEDEAADFDELFFVGSPAVREALAKRETIVDSGIMVLSGSKIADVPYKGNNNITGNDIFLGAFSTIKLFKFFGGVEVHINPYSKDKEGVIRMLLTLYANFVIRNPKLIVYGTSFS